MNTIFICEYFFVATLDINYIYVAIWTWFNWHKNCFLLNLRKKEDIHGRN